MTPNTDLTRFVIETPDFVRSMTRARHLMREAELATSHQTKIKPARFCGMQSKN